MAEAGSELVFAELADHLREQADDLTDVWLERLEERLGVRPRRLLPTKELRDHVPAVLRGIADVLEGLVNQPPNETVDILRMVAQLRREQGYDIQELLTEIGVLSDLVFERAAGWLEDRGTVGGGEAMRAAARLASALGSIAGVAVGTYREEELRHNQELADRLADFAGMVTHELVNPINTALISAELLDDESIAEDPGQRHKHTDRIRERLERVQQLVDDLRSLAVAENARAEPAWLSVREVVDTVRRETEPVAEREGVELRIDDPDEDFEVDAVRVEIALMNLVSNAIKFADPEKPDRWVCVRFEPSEREGVEVGRCIIVEDNGRGIEPGSQAKVFQRFFRGHPGVEGTGLGLAIARRVVEQRGGQLWFESEPGKGTTFYMDIPPRLDTSEPSGRIER